MTEARQERERKAEEARREPEREAEARREPGQAAQRRLPAERSSPLQGISPETTLIRMGEIRETQAREKGRNPAAESRRNRT